MMIEAELIHSRRAEAEMLFPVLRDSEVASWPLPAINSPKFSMLTVDGQAHS